LDASCKNTSVTSSDTWVRETRFGRWFLSTDIWRRYVLGEAIVEFERMLGGGHRGADRILDAGCGVGLSFPLLEHAFQPRSIFGVDVDRELIRSAEAAARQCHCQVLLESAPIVDLGLPSESVDVVFCHQLLHHTAEQEGALREFHRLLVPGGVVLIGESCRPFIHSLPVRLLFRHPMMVQKTASEYVELVTSMGFEVGEGDLKASTPWWSRRDLGLTEKLGITRNKPPDITEVLIVARKPAT
jgi:SAM-dependent methyltransferase